eukprot:307567_1
MSSIACTPEWASLKEKANTMQSVHLRDLMGDSVRCSKMTAKHKGIVLDFSRQKVENPIMDLLCSLADKAELGQKRVAMYEGQKINETEDRAVLHTALRAPRDAVCMVDGKNVIPEVHAALDKICSFTAGVRSGEFRGCTRKSIKNVISVGIGGSYLGPEFVHEALRTDKIGEASAKGRTLRFLANVDPVDMSRAINGLDPEETLVVIISKTFTTAETMLNALTLKDWLVSAMGHKVADPSEIVSSHMVAVSTSSEKCAEFGIAPNNVFGFWDWVGGRYSVCSAVGIVPLSLQYGFEQMRCFLDGANDIDTHFMEAPHLQNIPVLLGLLGIWNSSFLGYSSRAILPYSQALTRFAAHIQQVDMESNGKSVAMDGSPLPFEAGEINFGEPGTNGQHSFYQLLHQGRVVPAEFIGFCKSPSPIHLSGEYVSNHDERMIYTYVSYGYPTTSSHWALG